MKLLKMFVYYLPQGIAVILSVFHTDKHSNLQRILA